MEQAEEDTFETPEVQSSMAERELDLMVNAETESKEQPVALVSPVQRENPAPTFLPISRVDMPSQEPMEWDEDHQAPPSRVQAPQPKTPPPPRISPRISSSLQQRRARGHRSKSESLL